uniref:Uncharacterized protein n=1 Tax=Anguilla anguilla TaxID=7936 RepID=A0A0E9RI60_ANGAN
MLSNFYSSLYPCAKSVVITLI